MKERPELKIYIFSFHIKVYFLCVGHSFAYVAQFNYCEISEFELRVHILQKIGTAGNVDMPLYAFI
jgi:hypothetical protein